MCSCTPQSLRDSFPNIGEPFVAVSLEEKLAAEGRNSARNEATAQIIIEKVLPLYICYCIQLIVNN